MDCHELAHLRRARDLLDREYARPLDVPAMARAALMSPSHFSRQFRVAFGETPYAYLQSRRLERAMALLMQGSSILDTVYQVGYADQPHMTRALKHFIGQTPGQIARVPEFA